MRKYPILGERRAITHLVGSIDLIILDNALATQPYSIRVIPMKVSRDAIRNQASYMALGANEYGNGLPPLDVRPEQPITFTRLTEQLLPIRIIPSFL